MAHWGGTADKPALFFDGPEDFRAWLEEHHETATELWMGLYRKGSREQSLTWDDAVPEALCFGWIDSRAEGIDDTRRRQRWTPRKPSGNWSTVNLAHVERLMREGRMRPAGIAAWERRKPARSGVYSYEQRNEIALPENYAHWLAQSPAATAFWGAATPSYRALATYWVVSAKTEATNDKRMRQLVQDSAAGRLIPSQRYGKEPTWVTRAAAAARDATAGGEH